MRKYIPHIIIGLILLLGSPVFFYCIKFNTWSDSSGDWGTFGDYYGGLLNPLLGLLTLIVTSYIAHVLYSYENKRDRLSKKESDVNSFKELYQFFISNEFQKVRVISWYILKKAIGNDKYSRFLLNENYVSRYVLSDHRANIYPEFKNILYLHDHPDLIQPSNEKDFLQQEAKDRNKVDTLVNFFQLLSFKDIPTDYFKICDFYYDTWRPVLYWYANGQKDVYSYLEQNRRYNNPPTLLEALERLDKVFFKPEILTSLNEQDINKHPIIMHMKGV